MQGHKRYRFDSWVGKSPCRKTWQPIPVFLPGESHGQKSLVGCSSQGHKESDTTLATEHACRYGGSASKESTCPTGDLGLDVFLPGIFHGQRSLAGYHPWGRGGSDVTEQLTLSSPLRAFHCPGWKFSFNLFHQGSHRQDGFGDLVIYLPFIFIILI